MNLFAEDGSRQFAFVDVDITAFLDRRDGLRVGRGPPHAMLFEGFNEQSFGVRGWWFGEMLCGRELERLNAFAHCEQRQLRVDRLIVIAVDIIRPFDLVFFFAVVVEAEKTVKGQLLSFGAEDRCPTADLPMHFVEHRIRHLTGEKPLVDQFIQIRRVVAV